jgi:hypothetical protein
MVTARDRKKLHRRQVLGFNSINTEGQGILTKLLLTKG